MHAARVIHFEGQMLTKQSPRAIVGFHKDASRYYCKHDARSPWHPMQVVAFLGLSMRAAVMLVLNRFRPSPVPRSAEVSFAACPIESGLARDLRGSACLQRPA